IETRVGGELGRRRSYLGVDALGIACDDGAPELGLAREVVVETRLGNRELSGHVRVAEAVVATDLDEPFADVQDPRARAHRLRVGVRAGGSVALCGGHRRIIAVRLTA